MGEIMTKFINMRDGEITFDSYRLPDAECTTEEDLYRRHENGSKATLTADIEPKPVGRPSSLQNGKRVNVYLDAISLDAAAKLGNGNVSEGIRLALQKSML
jgi:hypothetical protein